MTTPTSNGQRSRNEEATETTDRVGSFDMGVMLAEASAAAAERWSQRAEALTAWLVAEWRREQRTEAPAIDRWIRERGDRWEGQRCKA